MVDIFYNKKNGNEVSAKRYYGRKHKNKRNKEKT